MGEDGSLPEELAAIRNTQLDGWRAFAVVGVMCQHWLPLGWHGVVPFEIGLFFFLTLTGFLITRILLRERDQRESERGWRWRAHGEFLKRRLVRVWLPCYAAMVFAWGVGAPDIREHGLAYFGHWSNFHMAWRAGWPSGTAHFWTLAIQIQFYLVWPVVVFWVPRRWLGAAFVGLALLAPVSRWVLDRWVPGIVHGEAISTCALDYFGVGAWLALAMARGWVVAGDKRLAWVAWCAFLGYAAIYGCAEMGVKTWGLRYVQQSLVAVAFAGLICGTQAGFGGVLGRALDHRAVQHVGRLSFGLYLFHTPVPLFLGWVLPQLWEPMLGAGGVGLRIGVFVLTSWGLAWLCWRWLESTPRQPSGSAP